VDSRIIRKPRPKVPLEERLARLEERYRHELTDDEEHQELRDRILRLRRRLSS
jgi:predicted RNase H-like nuclease (RuvC/YqgF family)